MGKPRIALVEAATGSVHVYSRTYLPRVGIPTIGAVLRDKGYQCDLWFQSMSCVTHEKLREYDIVGIGSLSSTIEEAYRLADTLHRSGVTVVMGGPHPTFMPEEVLDHCDYVVLGEGDETFPALVRCLETGSPVQDVPGLAMRNGSGEVHYTGTAAPVDFASLPSPDFSLSPQVTPGCPPPIITTSRGCPHNCTFCSVTAVFGRRYRHKSIGQVIAELEPVADRSVCFGDDNFCANPSRTKELLAEMAARDAAPLRWSGEMCVKAAADLELLDLMQKTGCRIVFVGIESVSAETLKKFGKSHQKEDASRCVKNLHSRDIGIHGMFVLGADDTPDTARGIADFAIENDIDTIQVFALTPFPGTKACQEHKDRLLHREWRYFDGMHVVMEPVNCSAYELQRAIVREMNRFYSLRRAAGAWRRGRGWRVKYRLGGHYLMRRWVGENKDYMERLRTGFGD